MRPRRLRAGGGLSSSSGLLARIEDRRERLVWGAVGAGTAVIATVLTRKALRSGWRRVAGEDPPSNPASPATTWEEAVVWSVGTGAFIGLARVVARRLAASGWRKLVGELPPR